MDKSWLLFGGFALILLFAYRDHKREVRRRNVRAHLEARSLITLDELYALNYAGTDLPKTTVIKVFEGFSAGVGINAGLLRPEDTLEELGAAAGISPRVFLIEISAALARLKTEAGSDGSLGEIKTINEYVKVAAMLERREKQGERRPPPTTSAA